jgi:serine/threonine-protein kinase
MEANTWERLESIFFEAVALPPEERGAFLEKACAGDPDLRAEVEAVLAAHLGMGEGAPPEVPPDDRVGSRVGAYRLESLLGRGGMGDVYLARRADEQYEQEVAVKIVRSGLPPHEMVRRFRLERQILARLEHPNVATLLDGGVTGDGKPYLVMQFVGGAPITAWADARRLPVQERLKLFVTVCRAVQFAHANLVIHRDLKPSNILVTDDGLVRLLDFGIAKMMDPQGAEGTLATESLLLMTPEHAAPEQFLGQPITTATDIYQLGVLLHELLTGGRPFRAGTSLELHRAICELEPTRPSAGFERPGAGSGESEEAVAIDIARSRSTTPDGLRRQLRGDLDRIVLRALRKEPERRYGSAAELADDIERHLGGFPVEARPDTLGYVAGRLIRRHRMAFAAGLALAASLVALNASSLRFASTTSDLAATIAAERDVAVEVLAFLEGLFEASDPYAAGPGRRDTLRVRDMLDEGARRVRTGLEGRPLVQARLLTTLGRAYRNLGRFDDARPLLEEALAIRLRELGPDAPDLASSRTNLAQLLVARGEHEEAERLLRSSAATLERDSVTHARPLASTLAVLGNLLQEGGRHSEAEDAYRRALALSEADSTVDDGRRAEHLSNLATALVRQAELEEAEVLLTRSVELARAHFGSEHPTTASMLNNLGQVYRERGALDAAEGPLREALAIRRARFEAPQPELAVSVNNLADLLLARDEIAAAEPLFRESLEMRRALYGERHPAVGIGWINLAATLQRTEGGRDEAMRAYGEAREVLLATVGAEHPLLGAVDGNLGRLFHDTAEHERALSHYRSALEVRRGAFEPSHPLVLGTMSDIGRCLTELAGYGEAETMLLEAFAGLEPQREPQAVLRDSAIVRLGRLYRAMGREGEARRYEAMRDTREAPVS